MRTPIYSKHNFFVNAETYEGESIEDRVRRAETSNEPIQAGAPMMYTDRSKGVLAETDIRTDRWEIAQKAMDKVSGSIQAKRIDFIKKHYTNESNEIAEA